MKPFKGLGKYHYQRGVIAVTTPIIVLLILSFSVLMLDGARLYSEQRNMQSVVNAAATAGANEAQSCGGAEVSIAAIESAAVTAGELRGLSFNDGDSFNVLTGLVSTNTDNSLRFSPRQNIEETNAVRVEYRQSRNISSLLPSRFGQIELSAVAVAQKEAVATVSATGSTAVIGSDDAQASILGAVLGGLLNPDGGFSINPTRLRSLAETTFALGGLLERIGVDDLVNAVDEQLTLGELLEGVLNGINDPASDAALAITQILEQEGLLSTDLRLGDIIQSVGGVEYDRNTAIPVYDMLIVGVLNAAESLISVPINLNLLPGQLGLPSTINLLNITAELIVGNAPTIMMGPARVVDDNWLVDVRAADISVFLLVNANLLSIAEVTIPILVSTGGGRAQLISTECASGAADEIIFGFEAQTSVANLLIPQLGGDSRPIVDSGGNFTEGSINIVLLSGLGLDTLQPSISVSTGDILLGSQTDIGVAIPFQLISSEPNSESIQAGLGLSGVNLGVNVSIGGDFESSSCSGLFGCLIGGITGLLTSTLNAVSSLVGSVINSVLDLENALLSPLVTLINTLLLDVIEPVLQALGVNLGGLELTVLDARQDRVVLLDCNSGVCDLN